jgi:hypothetical protein
MNKYMLWVVVALFVLSLGAMAHMFRYEPLTNFGSVGGPMRMWDRWGHRICLVVFELRGVICTADDFQQKTSQPTSTGNEITKQSELLREQIRELSAAGFSEKEIEDWVQSQKKNTGTK